MKSAIIYLSFLFIGKPLLFHNDSSDHSPDPRIKKIAGEELPCFIDSVGKLTYNDTVRFSRRDLVHNPAIGTWNIKSYSPLYVVNDKFLYQLDIIEPSLVAEFVKQYLIYPNIEAVSVLDQNKAISIYGSRGSNGVIMITLKKGVYFNPKIAGLRTAGKRGGSNFLQKRPGEIALWD